MKMSRFFLAVIILGAALAAQTRLDDVLARASADIAANRKTFDDFPEVVGRWQVEKSALTTRQIDLLAVDDYLRADFSSPPSESISVYVGYYTHSDRATRHPPTICYPGSGWVQAYNSAAVLSAGGSGKEIHVQETVFDRGSEKQLVAYWYSMPGYEGAGTSWQKIASLKRMLTGKASAGAVKIQVAMPVTTTRRAAEGQLEEFLADFLPALEGFIPRDTQEGD